MFEPIQNGSIVDVQGMLCHIPPVGYITDYKTGKLKNIGVYRRHKYFEECYWEIDPRWNKYTDWDKDEKVQQKHNSKYRHPELEKFVDEMWLYRMGGFWFYNNDEPTYITGQNWFYLSVFHLDVGLPRYRDADREYFYAWQLCQEDPACFGITYITKRRSGKSYICGCVALELTTRQEKFNSGIQSKTDDDAKSLFRKAVIAPYRKMPFFFRPMKSNMDTSGKAPANELRFIGTKIDDVDDELDSMVDFKPSLEGAYDGQKLGLYIADEIGKVQKIDIQVRWDIVQFCLKDFDGRIIGKTIHTTTVEDMDGSMKTFFNMWKGSDHTNKKEGSTVTGMYRFYVTGDRVRCLDKYGRANKEQAINEILALRKSKESDPRALSALIRKDPLNIREFFLADADSCVFSDPIKLNNRLDELKYTKAQYKIGNFAWVNGDRDTTVEFIECPNGRWKVMYLPPEHMCNMFVMRNGNKFPNNTSIGRAGIDPFDYKMEHLSDQKRMSKGAICIKKCDDGVYSSPVDNGIAALYINRPNDPEVFYEDALMALFFYGIWGLFERNKSKILDYFEKRGYQEYLYWMPGEKVRGIYNASQSSGGGVNGKIAELTDSYINRYLDRIFFEEMIEGWLSFTPEDTTEFDGPMSFGFAEILDREIVKKYSRVSSTTPKISDILSFVN